MNHDRIKDSAGSLIFKESGVKVVVTYVCVYLSAMDVPFPDAAEHGLGVCL